MHTALGQTRAAFPSTISPFPVYRALFWLVASLCFLRLSFNQYPPLPQFINDFCSGRKSCFRGSREAATTSGIFSWRQAPGPITLVTLFLARLFLSFLVASLSLWHRPETSRRPIISAPGPITATKSLQAHHRLAHCIRLPLACRLFNLRDRVSTSLLPLDRAANLTLILRSALLPPIISFTNQTHSSPISHEPELQQHSHAALWCWALWSSRHVLSNTRWQQQRCFLCPSTFFTAFPSSLSASFTSRLRLPGTFAAVIFAGSRQSEPGYR